MSRAGLGNHETTRQAAKPARALASERRPSFQLQFMIRRNQKPRRGAGVSKTCGLAISYRPKVLTRNTAICARVTEALGQ